MNMIYVYIYTIITTCIHILDFFVYMFSTMLNRPPIPCSIFNATSGRSEHLNLYTSQSPIRLCQDQPEPHLDTACRTYLIIYIIKYYSSRFTKPY